MMYRGFLPIPYQHHTCRAALIFSLLFSLPATANDQLVDMDQTAWQSYGDKFSCQLKQELHDGHVEFVARAGYPVAVTMISSKKITKGSVTLTRLSAPWSAIQTSTIVGKGQINEDQSFVADGAQELVTAMQGGEWAQITLNDSTITLSNTNILKPAKKFQDCRNQLLPASYEQISLVRLQFSQGKNRPQPRFADILDHIATYIRHDPDIMQVQIDGHTENVGHHLENLEVAKIRAENIAYYLQSLGIPADKMIVRYHAERYPIATNATAAGRDKNRRVEIRLTRKDTPPDAETFFSP